MNRPSEIDRLLVEAREGGLSVYRLGARLRWRADRQPVPEALIVRLRERKAELRTIVPDELTWRVQAMLPQVPSVGPIKILIARDGAWPDDGGHCPSCGDLVDPSARTAFGGALRCVPCGEAARKAIRQGRGQ